MTNTKPSEPRPGSRASMHRYRAKHRRIDYVPAPDVLAIVERLRQQGTEKCLAGVIDQLVRAGEKLISGNGRRG